MNRVEFLRYYKQMSMFQLIAIIIIHFQANI